MLCNIYVLRILFIFVFIHNFLTNRPFSYSRLYVYLSFIWVFFLLRRTPNLSSSMQERRKWKTLVFFLFWDLKIFERHLNLYTKHWKFSLYFQRLHWREATSIILESFGKCANSTLFLWKPKKKQNKTNKKTNKTKTKTEIKQDKATLSLNRQHT